MTTKSTVEVVAMQLVRKKERKNKSKQEKQNPAGQKAEERAEKRQGERTERETRQRETHLQFRGFQSCQVGAGNVQSASVGRG